MTTPQFTDHYLAGAIGPRRLRNGTDSDLETGELRERGIGKLLISGVEFREAPLVEDNSSSMNEISRNVYTGDIAHLTTSRDAFYGPPDGHGRDPLPYIRIFDAELGAWTVELWCRECPVRWR